MRFFCLQYMVSRSSECNASGARDRLIYTLEYSIIAIPSCGSLPVDNWGVSAALNLLPKDFESVVKISVLSFEYTEILDEIGTWEALLNLGNDLLDHLLQRKLNLKVSSSISLCTKRLTKQVEDLTWV